MSGASKRPVRRQASSGRGITVGVIAVTAMLFLSLPVLVVLPMSFSSASNLAFPPPGFSLRWYEALFSDPEWLEALWTSLWVGLVVSALSTAIAGLGVYGLVRGGHRFGQILMWNALGPLVMPQIITAIALYLAFARMGVLGSLGGLIAAHLVLTIPYVVLVMTAALRNLDPTLEQAAKSMGASRFTTFRTVVLPLLRPSLAAAALFAFVASFDEAVVTLFVAGQIETAPKKMFAELVMQIDPTITAISSLLILFSIGLLAVSSLLLKFQGQVQAPKGKS